MRVLFIQHDHTSPPGLVGERFSDRGYGIEEFLVVPANRFLDPGVTVDFPDPTGFDALVPMGAPWSVYDKALIGSWVEPELELLRRASTEGIPVLGLCFGGQLLAAAHGGNVVRTEVPEVGWHVVHTDEPELLAPGPWFQWHFDRWQAPPDAREIARNGAASQAFVTRRNLALQFHPELDPAMLTGWLDNGGASALAERGYDVPAIIEHTRTETPAARTRAHHLVDAFLDRVARTPVVSGS
jgi:GMP synthase-like glutamine amidotransferase